MTEKKKSVGFPELIHSRGGQQSEVNSTDWGARPPRLSPSSTIYELSNFGQLTEHLCAGFLVCKTKRSQQDLFHRVTGKLKRLAVCNRYYKVIIFILELRTDHKKMVRLSLLPSLGGINCTPTLEYNQ